MSSIIQGMSDEKVYQPVAELMEKIETQYGKEAVEKTEYMMQEAVFAVNNGLLSEEVLGLMDPRLSQPVMREMLLARSEGVPTEELKKMPTLCDHIKILQLYDCHKDLPMDSLLLFLNSILFLYIISANLFYRYV